MKITDVKDLTQNAIAQAMGDEYMGKLGSISALSDYQLIDVGRDVVNSGTTETVTKALISQIARLEIISDRYERRLKNIFVNADEWGGFLERVYFDLADVLDDNMYNLVDGTDYSNREHTFYKPKASAKIFEEGKAILIPISITTDQFKEAFSGWEQLNRFLSGIRQNVRNTLDVTLDAYAHMLYSCGIAISEKATHTSIHLLSEAKEKGIVGADETLQTLSDRKAFYTYCVSRINKVREYIKTLSTGFNNKSIPTFASSVGVTVLYDFLSDINYNVKPTDFNNYVSLGEVDTVVRWQGVNSGASEFDFETLSTIKISADADNKLGIGTAEVTLKNAVALVHDKKALGISTFKEKMTSSYTANADFWNEFLHILVNYIIDANMSMVAFFLD